VSKTTRDNFSSYTIKVLANRVATICSNPKCEVPTYGPHTEPTKFTNKGVAAHITAASPGGARYNPDLSRQERSSIDNAIWLCQSCAKMIDNDEERFPVELLREWKHKTETRARNAIENPHIIETGIPNIGSLLLITSQNNTRLREGGKLVKDGPNKGLRSKKITISPIRASRDLINQNIPIFESYRNYPLGTEFIAVVCQNQGKSIDTNIKIRVTFDKALIGALRVHKENRMQVIEGGEKSSYATLHIPQLLPGEAQQASIELSSACVIDATLWSENSGDSKEIFIFKVKVG